MERTPLMNAKRAVTLKKTTYKNRERRFRKAQEMYLLGIEEATAVYQAMLRQDASK